MKKILITSTNPVKKAAAEEGFHRVFPNEETQFETISVPSHVSDQPMSEGETFQGAMNRIMNAKRQDPTADYYVGIEGGLEQVEEELVCFAWVIIQSKEKIGKAKTATFILPKKVQDLLLQGIELGKADDIVFGHTNSKQKTGSVGILTHDIITRTSYYTEAVILALIPFINPQLY